MGLTPSSSVLPCAPYILLLWQRPMLYFKQLLMGLLQAYQTKHLMAGTMSQSSLDAQPEGHPTQCLAQNENQQMLHGGRKVGIKEWKLNSPSSPLRAAPSVSPFPFSSITPTRNVLTPPSHLFSQRNCPRGERDSLKITHSQDCTLSSVSETRVGGEELVLQGQATLTGYPVSSQFCNLLVLA